MKDNLYLINFLVMNLAWSTASFNYYMLNYYLKYVPGDIYTNIIVASVSDMFASLISGLISNFIGTKKTIIFSFFMAFVFGLPLIFIREETIWLIIICVILSKFGINSSFNMCYIITAEYFPI
jgi:MFS family permease